MVESQQKLYVFQCVAYYRVLVGRERAPLGRKAAF